MRSLHDSGTGHKHADSHFCATACGGMAVGAALMYLFDPARGKRRRHGLRDKAVRAVHDAECSLAKAARYSSGRLRGIAHEAAHAFDGTASVGDEQLCARVRSALGRVVSHPRSVRVDASDGSVTLTGDVLADEQAALCKTVQRVRGVRDVYDALRVHDEPGNLPHLQGGRSTPHNLPGAARENWSPDARLAAGAAGAGLMAYAVARRCDPLGIVAGAAGVALAARAFTNLPARRLTGIGAGAGAIEVHKTINVHAPIDEVFGFFARYDNFPRFMHNVREVSDRGDGRSHWVVAGPAGVPVTWDAELMAYEPHRLIAWRSVPGAAVENAGVIRFDENLSDGSTRVDVRLCYNPIAGAVGHLIAKLFGADPRSEMNADLARAKTYLETGHPAHDAAMARGTRPAEQTRAAGAAPLGEYADA